jgi:hypothetical protein
MKGVIIPKNPFENPSLPPFAQREEFPSLKKHALISSKGGDRGDLSIHF